MAFFWSSKAKAEPQRRRVLVVEDSRTQAMELAIILRGHDFDTVLAPTAEEALRRLEQGDIDAVLTDIVMPGLNGYQLCRYIKDNPRLERIPVVLLTTLSDPMDVVHGIRAGADNFFVKPYEPNDLVARLNGMLARAANPKAVPAQGPTEFLLLGESVTLSADKGQMFTLLFASFEHYAKARRRDERNLQELKTREAAANRELVKLHQAQQQLRTILDTMHSAQRSVAMVAFRRIASYLGWLREDVSSSQSALGERNFHSLQEEIERLQQQLTDSTQKLGELVELLQKQDRRTLARVEEAAARVTPKPAPPTPDPTKSSSALAHSQRSVAAGAKSSSNP
jgi:DNA-binding response OmpR family regulator